MRIRSSSYDFRDLNTSTNSPFEFQQDLSFNLNPNNFWSNPEFNGGEKMSNEMYKKHIEAMAKGINPQPFTEKKKRRMIHNVSMQKKSVSPVLIRIKNELAGINIENNPYFKSTQYGKYQNNQNFTNINNFKNFKNYNNETNMLAGINNSFVYNNYNNYNNYHITNANSQTLPTYSPLINYNTLNYPKQVSTPYPNSLQNQNISQNRFSINFPIQTSNQDYLFNNAKKINYYPEISQRNNSFYTNANLTFNSNPINQMYFPLQTPHINSKDKQLYMYTQEQNFRTKSNRSSSLSDKDFLDNSFGFLPKQNNLNLNSNLNLNPNQNSNINQIPNPNPNPNFNFNCNYHCNYNYNNGKSPLYCINQNNMQNVIFI